MLDIQEERKNLHALIDHLSARQVVAVRGLLDAMLDPFEQVLAGAKTDDEPLTDDERRDIDSSREWFRHNKGTSFEQVVSELGLTMEEVRNYDETGGDRGRNHP
jgi:DNA-directed RNA polymerase sigma subunit (sigma70/sigma32)